MRLVKNQYWLKFVTQHKYDFIAAAFIVALILQMFSMFYPYLSGKIVVVNNYINIPEETKSPCGYIDNLKYIGYVAKQDANLPKQPPKDNPVNDKRISNEGTLNNCLSVSEFFDKNRTELSWLTMCGWFMHHHNALLAPINEYTLGRHVKDIFFIYGSFNTIILAELIKMSGGVTLENYFKVLYSFYPLYYLLFLTVIFIIFRRTNYLLLSAIIAFSFLNNLNFISIYLAPGFNPIRQLFFLPMFLFLYLYFKQQKTILFLLVCFFSLVSLLACKEFGICGILALCAIIFIKNLNEKNPARMKEITIILITLILASLFWQPGKSNATGVNSLKYSLRLFAPLAGKNLLNFILICLSFCYVVFIKVMKTKGYLKYLALFLFIYFQGILVYYVWNPAPNHFSNISMPLVLMIILILKIFLNSSHLKKYENIAVNTLIIILFFAAYLPSLKSYYLERSPYQKIVDDHKIYDWDLPAAKIKSTMNPGYFLNAVELIHKYSPDSNSIYIISKYDNLLPFLARRYSMMPYHEVGVNLITEKEVKLCIDAILRDKPQYLFVDSDIDGDEFLNNIKKSSTLRREGLDPSLKIEMSAELRKIYSGVKEYYNLLKRGDIISVYKLKG